MPPWNDLLEDLGKIPDDNKKSEWIRNNLEENLTQISSLRGGRNVLFYASAFLTKPQAPSSSIQLTLEEINGFMSVMYGMDWDKGLTLILHTPGGLVNAVDTVVSYLHSKFDYIESIVPTFAMSAGTMIALATNKGDNGATESTWTN